MKTLLSQHAANHTNRAPSALKAVIFDVDGTLAETEQDGHREAFNHTFAEFGLDWHWSDETYRRLLTVAGGKERIRHYATTRDPEMPRQRGFEDWLANVHRRKSEIYSYIVLAGNIPLRPGVQRLIRELKERDIRLAIATTTAASSVNSLIMRNFGCPMESLFEAIGTGDQIRNKKPAPDVYTRVLQQMGLPAESCVAIEDSAIGLSAARAAGVPSVITVSRYSAGEDFPGALSIVSDLGEPGAPASHLGGQPLSGDHVNLDQLERWHAPESAH